MMLISAKMKEINSNPIKIIGRYKQYITIDTCLVILR